MIISNSSLAMAGKSSYTSSSVSTRGIITQSNLNTGSFGSLSIFGMDSSQNGISTHKTNSNTYLQLNTMSYLLQLLFRRQVSTSPLTQALQDVLEKAGIINPSYEVNTYEYYEAESVNYSAVGCVQSADGRTIDFDLNLTMSRSFYESYSETYTLPEPDLEDPLVINFDANATELSDQKFYFDLDGNGTKEYINKLQSGSGFLALDKNDNGTIDSGTELFGAQTGDGFSDLTIYDEDGNGWIDEADTIFSKLKIWAFDGDGNGSLYTLKEAGVGAICLQRAAGNFHLKDQANRTRGLIRSTGLFLFESGKAGTLQQVDLATETA